MSKAINPQLTGPGYCKYCGDFVSDRPAKGLCRRCYDRQHRTTDPFARAERDQEALDKAPTKLVQIQALAKKLLNDGILEQLDWIVLHRTSQKYLDRMRDMTAADLEAQERDGMSKLGVTSQHIQPNPNQVEVEESSNQPQADSAEDHRRDHP